MSLATPTFKPSVSWDQRNRVLFREGRWPLHKESREHSTVLHTLSAATEAPLWFQVSPASNRFLLEATGSETPVSSGATWLPDLLSFEDTWETRKSGCCRATNGHVEVDEMNLKLELAHFLQSFLDYNCATEWENSTKFATATLRHLKDSSRLGGCSGRYTKPWC